MEDLLEITALGGLTLKRGGQPVEPLIPRKGQALLLYLACTGRPHFRETLAEFLWEERSQERALSNLRTLTSRLRKHLTPFIIVTRQGLAFNQESLHSIDVVQLEAGIHTAREQWTQVGRLDLAFARQLESVVALYQGDFLAGFYVHESQDFEDWVLTERERLRQDVIEALHYIVASFQEHQLYASAMTVNKQLLQLDPLREEAHQQLMTLLTLTGQRAKALAHYQTYHDLLKTEMDLEPSQDTTALYAQIQAGAFGGRPATAQPVTIRAYHPPRHLPSQPTPFVGRTKELAQIAMRLDDATCRLLTLVGPGGIGKTRLALQAAAQHTERFTDGVYFISLASISDPALLVSAVGDAFDISLSRQEDPKIQLLHYLSDKSALLVMDNFEHLLQGAGLVSDLLDSAPGVKILTTSRERLFLQEEWLIQVEGLDFPAHDDPSRIEDYSAVQLFLQQARRVQPGFSLAEESDRNAVIGICRLVEGMPLGIELAATWLRVMSCSQVIGRIVSTLDFLATPTRNVPERHRSIRALFEHSMNLLSPSERAVLMRLAVFRGGFTLEAAEQVTGTSIAILVALIDKSLVRPERAGRYDMHDLLRQYAHDKLVESGEARQVQNAHFDFFLRLSQEAKPLLEKTVQGVWLRRLDQEQHNLRGALRWSIEGGDAESGLRLGSALWLFWFMRGYLSEGREYLAEILKLAQDPTATRAEAFDKAGVLARYQGDYGQAYTLINEALAIYRALGDQQGIANALANLGFVTLHQGNHTQAGALYTESLILYREMGNGQGIADSLSHLGLMAFYEGDYTAAHSLDEESLAIWRQLGDKQGIAWALHILGNVFFGEKIYASAHASFAESLAISKDIEYQWGLAWSMEDFARLASAREDFARALCLAGAAATLRQAIGLPLPLLEQTELDHRLEIARQTIGGELSAAAWTKGQMMTLEQIMVEIEQTESG